MGFKDAIITNLAGHVFEAIDKQVNGQEVVQKIKADLVNRNVPPQTIKAISQGPIFNMTCEMQEGLWQDNKALAMAYRYRANLLDPTPAAKPK